MACLMLMAVSACSKPQPLPKIARVPAFELVAQNGEGFGRDDLQGQVWIANFMFTSCPTICPRLTEQMRSLQADLSPASGFHLVSFSVDPRNDTPERLQAYAREHEADPATWTFLTGPLDQIREVVVSGFKQMMEHKQVEPGEPADILHGSHFVLVDAAGHIRGYYPSDAEGMKRLLSHTRALLEQD